MKDKNDKPIKKGSIINIFQTINGENIFIILSVDPLDIRYRHDLMRQYEYDKLDLLSPSMYDGEVDWEIIGNIYEDLLDF
jgi:hypothetical protein